MLEKLSVARRGMKLKVNEEEKIMRLENKKQEAEFD